MAKNKNYAVQIDVLVDVTGIERGDNFHVINIFEKILLMLFLRIP
jgi:hypothetical protein